MIAVDTSALLAVLLNELRAPDCIAALETDDLLISAVTVAEALIVGRMRNIEAEVDVLLRDLGFEIVPVTAAVAQRVAEAYGRYGKGVHPAGLNFGDCFAYVLARDRRCPLLYVGEDFSRTDIASALSQP